MKERTFERLGALSGLAFVVLALLSGFIYPQQPRVDSTPATTLTWVVDHRVALQTGMIFDYFAAGVLLWFVAYLHRVLRRAEDSETLAPIVFAAGIGVAITTTLAALPTALLAFMVAQPGGLHDPSLVRMLGDLNTLFFSATSVMTALFLVGLGLAMLGRELATRWLGWLSLVVAIFNGLAVWIGVTFSSYHGKGWQVVGWGAYIGFLVVMVLVSAYQLRQSDAAAPSVVPSVAVS